MGVKIKGDYFSGVPLCFRWCLGITSFLRPLRYSLEFSRRRLGTNSVWRSFGSPLVFAIPGDSFSGIPPCFPPLGFTLIVRSRVTTFSPVGVFLFFSFLGGLHLPRYRSCRSPVEDGDGGYEPSPNSGNPKYLPQIPSGQRHCDRLP